jgi:hypothetical protein
MAEGVAVFIRPLLSSAVHKASNLGCFLNYLPRIDTSGRVNIGPAVAPDNRLTVNSNTGASVTLIGDGLHLVASDAGVGGIIQIHQSRDETVRRTRPARTSIF